jgi:hypothetical protein
MIKIETEEYEKNVIKERAIKQRTSCDPYTSSNNDKHPVTKTFTLVDTSLLST